MPHQGDIKKFVQPLDSLDETRAKKRPENIEDWAKVMMRLLYYTGARLLIKANRVKRKADRLFRRLGKWLRKEAVQAGRHIVRGYKRNIHEFTDIFHRTGHGYEKSRKRILERFGDNTFSNFILGLYTVQHVCRSLMKLLLAALNYVAPVVAAAFLVFTWNFFANISYGLEVQLNGQTLGYIVNEGIYETAEQEMQRRIFYQDGDEPLSTTPSFSLAVVSSDEMMDYQQLCDQIILCSDNDITYATGLIIDGSFKGATTEPMELVMALEGILDQFRIGANEEVVEFVDDVRMTAGYYLTSSLVDVRVLTDFVTQEKQTEKIYVVEDGDTPSEVAQKLNISYSEFLALNPTAEEVFFVGTELVVQNPEPYLSVRTVAVETYEADLPYETIPNYDDTKYTSYYIVNREGESGKARYVDSVTYVNGVRVESTNISRTVLEEPTDQLVTRGTRETPVSGTISVSAAAIDETSPTGYYQWPVGGGGGRVTYGWYGYYGHTGVDIVAPTGTATYAADSGVVELVQYLNYGYGYQILINHGNGKKTRYAHHSEILVRPGDQVTQGQQIGRVGSTGMSSAPHLHFEVIINGAPVNPQPYLGY